MIGTHTQIVLALTPERIRGAVVRAGRIVRAEEVQTDPGQWDAAWEQGLVPLDRPLRQLLSRLRHGRGQSRVTLLYHTRSAVVQTHEIPGSREDARRAGALKARETGGVAALADAVILGPVAAKENTWSVLGVADREDDTNKLYAWATRCGAQIERLVPEPAATVRAAADRVLASEEPIACCSIGPGWSTIVVGSREGLSLIRAFEFGHRLLSDVFQRAIGTDENEPDASVGERTLFEHGLPFKSSDIDPVIRARILPLVAPVLQRFCVEIKQTIRFGLTADQTPATLLLDGPGASVPHLASAVTDTLNMHVRSAPGREDCDVLEPFANGTFERDWVRSGAPSIALVPHAAAEQRQSQVLRRCLAAGVLGAAALLGAEYAHITTQNRALEPRFEQHAATLAALNREEDARERIERLASASGRVAIQLRETAGQHADWPAVLALLAECASEHVYFDEIETTATATGAEVRLKGSTTAPSDAEASAALTELVQSLQASPLIESTNLGATTRDTQADDRAVRHFQLALRVKPARTLYDPLADHALRRAAEQEED